MAIGKCENCGAPHEDGLACCRFCDVPIPGRGVGPRCPQCGEMATADRKSCAAFNASFMKGCLFCGQVAFITATSCPKCMEAFAGAAERKKAREDQVKQQQMMGIAQQGVSILGQVAGTPSGRNMLGQLFDMVIKSNGSGS
jgi:hypothetical protein